MDLSPSPRTCPKCKQKDAIPAGDTRLSCPLCREKAKELQRKYYYRVKEREAAAKKFENEQTAKPLKRKRDPPTDEYQSADGLYKALRTTLRDATSSAGHRTPSFRGCFSIVLDPSVNHLDRARTVTKDLKKIVKYPLANLARDAASDNTSARITADCQCLTLANVASSSRPAKSVPSASPWVSHPLNSVPSSRNGDKFVEALEASFERNCGGKVKISVKGDFSHPLGISGQKVTVKIVH
ncbi:hypothetical protein M378DRAFT_664138 [Amanita muscaria Koide BX008]|uniref:Uncharacterized protein n=1 Tax=Amanita muscaria (strain Koide BX008) TaxID=946122 RepID=A0A0C2X2X5_AMAMK|nr:hypothetical protein M378DRAFT_664138 [Amanita muscaria Koide BX008]